MVQRIFPDKCVVLDLETTGNRPQSGDQIIQIGMCIIKQGKIVEQYTSLVKPTISIPPYIEQLTGITNERVEHAPTIQEVLPKVIAYLEQGVLVAHNIHFELSFLQYVLEEHGYPPFSGLMLDTVELARILLPGQQGYRLEQLAQHFQLVHHCPHQADSDALATAQLFIALVEKLSRLPLITIQRLIPLARMLHSDLEVLLRRVEREKSLHPDRDDQARDWHEFRQLALKKQPEQVKPASPDQEKGMAHSSFSFRQVLERAIADYDYRAGQEKLYRLIRDAFAQEQHGLFEVGTGTGKTIAYLIAALLWAKEKGKPVVISTHTLLLQEQLVQKELPLLKKALPFSFSAQVLKGRHHYLCLRKFETALFDREYSYDLILTKMMILVWLTSTENGDVEEINLPTGGREFWQLVASDASSCLHQKCPWYAHCFYFRAKKEALKADLVITNHALLLADAKRDNRLLPHYQYLIVDEAHHLEQVAREQWGRSSQYRKLHYLIHRLTLTEADFFAKKIAEFLPLVSVNPSLPDLLLEAGSIAEQLKEALAQFFTHVVQYAEAQHAGHTEGNIREVLINPEDPAEDATWQRLAEQAENMLKMLFRLKDVQRQFVDELFKEAVLTHSQQALIEDWQGLVERLHEEMEQLKPFFQKDAKAEWIKWIAYEVKGAKNSATLHQQPLKVDQLLQETLFNRKKSVVFTSASLQINHSFDYVHKELGIPVERVKTAVIPSPFDYQQQACLLIPKYISSLSEVDEETYFKEVAEDLKEVAQLTQGRMLVLFTSYQALKMVHSQIKEALSKVGISCLAQGIDSGSKSRLTKHFQSKQKAVLLGTSSFWEGIDLPGEALSCLVITKLPFSPPHTPLYLAKERHLKAEGKNPFKDYALPQAIIRFKQGFGRLIRKKGDKGIFLVYDRRLMEAGYGKLFLKSLPEIKVEEVDKRELGKQVKLWLN